MHPLVGCLLLVALAAPLAPAAPSEGGNVTAAVGDGGGLVPLAHAKVKQIIAREGSCVLIDCNVTGDPFPSFQWFNSHGQRLDTESEGEAGRRPPPPPSFDTFRPFEGRGLKTITCEVFGAPGRAACWDLGNFGV